jgi:hypothetical protein
MGWASRLAKGVGRRQGDGGQKAEARQPRFIPVRLVAPSPADHTEDAPRLAAEVILTSGRRVRLSGELRLDQLGQLLDALECPRAC